MAKDPAFLFYTQDFHTGTMFFTDEQVGKYIRLMVAQHQHGHLTEKQVLSICKGYDEEVLSKFVKDEKGNFYNVRLDQEITRRKNFTESRRQNAKNPKKKDEASAEHMLQHMETATTTIVLSKELPKVNTEATLLNPNYSGLYLGKEAKPLQHFKDLFLKDEPLQLRWMNHGYKLPQYEDGIDSFLGLKKGMTYKDFHDVRSNFYHWIPNYSSELKGRVKSITEKPAEPKDPNITRLKKIQ